MEGVLAMQVHVGPAMTIEHKDMRIKHLPDDLPLHTAKNNPIPKVRSDHRVSCQRLKPRFTKICSTKNEGEVNLPNALFCVFALIIVGLGIRQYFQIRRVEEWDLDQAKRIKEMNLLSTTGE